MVEQRSPKPMVEGSSPSAPANQFKGPVLGFFVFISLQNQVQPVSFCFCLLPFFLPLLSSFSYLASSYRS